MHSETGATPAERYHAAARTRHCCAGRSWREQRKVTAFGTVSLHGNRYEGDAALVGRAVDLLFTPFDLTVIEVEYQGRPMGKARPHQIGRHVHPAVKPDDTPPVQATGIDYLRLLEDAHQREVGHAINYPALAEDTPIPGDQDGAEPA